MLTEGEEERVERRGREDREAASRNSWDLFRSNFIVEGKRRGGGKKEGRREEEKE